MTKITLHFWDFCCCSICARCPRGAEDSHKPCLLILPFQSFFEQSLSSKWDLIGEVCNMAVICVTADSTSWHSWRSYCKIGAGISFGVGNNLDAPLIHTWSGLMAAHGWIRADSWEENGVDLSQTLNEWICLCWQVFPELWLWLCVGKLHSIRKHVNAVLLGNVPVHPHAMIAF